VRALLAALLALAGCATDGGDSALDATAAEARRLDTLRPSLVAAIQHENDDVDGAEEWAAGYNAFTTGGGTAALIRYAEATHASGDHSETACARLRPLAALVATADALSRRGLALPLIDLRSFDAIAAIEDRCEFQPLAVPIAPS